MSDQMYRRAEYDENGCHPENTVYIGMVPVKTAKVFRMVATKPDGKLKRWPFAKEAAAAKHLADLRIDIAKRPECGYHDPYLQSRQVTPWT